MTSIFTIFQDLSIYLFLISFLILGIIGIAILFDIFNKKVNNFSTLKLYFKVKI